MTACTFRGCVEWLEERRQGGNPDPEFLCQDLPQGVLRAGRVVVDKKDGTPAIALTVQATHFEHSRKVRKEPYGPVEPVVRFWDPEAALVIRLALANGGTMQMNVRGDENDNASRRGYRWFYPSIYDSGVRLRRVFMNVKFGQQVVVHANLTRPFRHRDCRRRHLFIWPGGRNATRGVGEFLDIAEEVFLRRNPLDGQTGPERFGVTPGIYRQLLTDGLQVLSRFNPSATPEQANAWYARNTTYGATIRRIGSLY